MRAWLQTVRAAKARRATERVIAALHKRKQMILAVDRFGEYVRIYVPCTMGIMFLSPRTAARHLMAIEEREFERALAQTRRRG